MGPPLTLDEWISYTEASYKSSMYPGLTDDEITQLWNNFGNANPMLRVNYNLHMNSLKAANPEATFENALSIMNAGVTWLIDTANSLPPPSGTPSGTPSGLPGGPPDH
jgi:hypothetical protein